MRELKFRVWSEEDREYRTDIKVSDLVVDIDGVPSTIHNAEGDRFDIEQYTGLKDKNGKEIYEGDIVDYNDDGECIGIVKYDAPEFYLDADATNWARMFLKGAPHQKVIGNVHENPELLGEKE